MNKTWLLCITFCLIPVFTKPMEEKDNEQYSLIEQYSLSVCKDTDVGSAFSGIMITKKVSYISEQIIEINNIKKVIEPKKGEGEIKLCYHEDSNHYSISLNGFNDIKKEEIKNTQLGNKLSDILNDCSNDSGYWISLNAKKEIIDKEFYSINKPTTYLYGIITIPWYIFAGYTYKTKENTTHIDKALELVKLFDEELSKNDE